MSATVTTRRPTRPEPPRPPRSARSRRRAVVTLVAALLAAVLLGTAAWLAYFSEALTTTAVRVVGNRQVTDAAVVDAVQVPLGVPLARQDVAGIARRATTLPPVRSAEVTRDWPHTLVVTVHERQPVLAVPQPGGVVVVDADGVAYEARASTPAGVLTADVDPGNVGLLRDLGVVAGALPPTLASKVDRVKATSRDNITLRLRSGVLLTWGDASDSMLKAEVAVAMLKRKPKVSIDVSSPHTPAER